MNETFEHDEKKPEEQQPIAVLERKVKGHTGWVKSVAVSPDGKWVVSGSIDTTVKIWDLESGQCRSTLEGHENEVNSVAITPDGMHILSSSNDKTIRLWDVETSRHLATWKDHNSFVFSVVSLSDGWRALSGADDYKLKLWEIDTGNCLMTLEGHYDPVVSVAVTRDGKRAVSGSWDNTIKYWNLETGQCLATLRGHAGWVRSVQFTPDGRQAVSGSEDKTIKLWDLETGTCVGTFEGHQSDVYSISISPDGTLVASAGFTDYTLRIWDLKSGACLQIVKDEEDTFMPIYITFSLDGSRLVAGTIEENIYIYHLTGVKATPAVEVVERYTNAKVVLVGESGVGKSALAHRLIEDKFVKTYSTHGMQVWRMDLPIEREEGFEKEALLWDLAGQADYRLIHQLFLDETALALMLINPQKEDLFAEVGDWLKVVNAATAFRDQGREAVKLLIAARTDVGNIKVSQRKIDRFLKEYGFADYLPTSAKRGDNCSDHKNKNQPSALKQLIAKHIPWHTLPWTATPRLLRELKNSVLIMKDKKNAGLLRFSELIQRLKQMLPKETFGNMDVKTAVTLLANHGLVMQLKFGDLLLLKPELLNGYASAVIRAARAHTDEIGCVAERDVFEKNIDFEGVDRLPDADEQLLLRAMVQTFMDKSLCIAEDTPEGKQLIFPSQYRRERPIPGYPEIFVSYTFTGELATVYTTLVVRLWYSREFYNKELWYNAAEFITSKEKTAGMVMKRTGEGEGTINVFFETGVPDELKLVFIKYVHEHLLKYARDVRRDRRYVCPNCGTPVEDREVVRMRLEDKKDFLYCQSCDEKILLIDQIEQRLISDPIVRKVFDMDRTAMRELDIQALEQILVGHMMAICGEANQIFRPLSMFDYGIDGEVEFKDNYGKASGKKIYVQLKSSSSHIRERKRDEKLIFDVKNPRHLEYWQNQSVDVYLVIRDAEEVIRWMNVTKYLRSHKNKKSRQIVFEGEELDASTLWRLRDNYLAISSPSPRKLIEPSIKEKEFATRLTQEGFEYLAKGELDTATEIFMNCLSMTKNNSDAVTGLIRVVQRTYKGSPSRANKILDQLIGKAPLSFAGQFCENLKLAEVTLAEELLVLVKRCILPITFLASKTGGLGWEIELTAIESQKVVNTNSVNAEYKGEDEVIINANIQDLPWGKYSLVVRFMAEGHEIWGGEKTIVNEDLKNPYIFGPPIRHGDRFFGRQDLINDLKWKLKDASVTLLGPRRSGKTSVLFQLREACKDDWAVVFIDLHSFSGLSTQNVLHDIIDEVQRACLPDHTPPENPKDLRTLRWLLDKAKVLRLLILLDEMAVLAEHPAVAFQLRALSKWTTPTARVVATGTVADLEKVVDSALEMHGSPPMNEFINLELDDISKHDAKELVQKPVLGKYRYQPDALSIILELGAGRPFFLNMLAHFALKSVQSEGTRLIERRHIEVARQESIYALDRWYPSLIGEIDDQTRTILPKLVKTPYKHLEHFMARSLRNAGLTIGPRSNLCLDPLFIDWWNQNKKENIKT